MIYKVNVEFNKDFLEISDGNITIGIKSKPVKGKANLEIIKKLSKHFDIPSNNIRIKSGHKSKDKTVEILN